MRDKTIKSKAQDIIIGEHRDRLIILQSDLTEIKKGMEDEISELQEKLEPIRRSLESLQDSIDALSERY